MTQQQHTAAGKRPNLAHLASSAVGNCPTEGTHSATWPLLSNGLCLDGLACLSMRVFFSTVSMVCDVVAIQHQPAENSLFVFRNPSTRSLEYACSRFTRRAVLPCGCTYRSPRLMYSGRSIQRFGRQQCICQSGLNGGRTADCLGSLLTFSRKKGIQAAFLLLLLCTSKYAAVLLKRMLSADREVSRVAIPGQSFLAMEAKQVLLAMEVSRVFFNAVFLQPRTAVKCK